MYIDGKILQGLVIRYNSGELELGGEICLMLQILAGEIMRAWKFDVDREAVIQDCVIVVWSKLSKFDKKRGTFFNWATTTILNHMKYCYREECNYNELKLRLMDRMCNEKKINKEDIRGWRDIKRRKKK